MHAIRSQKRLGSVYKIWIRSRSTYKVRISQVLMLHLTKSRKTPRIQIELRKTFSPISQPGWLNLHYSLCPAFPLLPFQILIFSFSSYLEEGNRRWEKWRNKWSESTWICYDGIASNSYGTQYNPKPNLYKGDITLHRLVEDEWNGVSLTSTEFASKSKRS